VNLLGDNIDTINKNTEALVGASEEVGIEVNIEKTKYMLVSLHQAASQNRDINIAHRSFQNVTVHISGNDSNKSKSDSGENSEETEFW
jgi:hypothetical protein